MKLWQALRRNRGHIQVDVRTEGRREPRTEGTVIARTAGHIETRTEGRREHFLKEKLIHPEPMDDPNRRTISPALRQTKAARLFRAIGRVVKNPARIREWLLLKLEKPVKVGRKLWQARPWRKPTAEERLYKEEQARRRKMANLLFQESNLYWDRLVNALDRRGFRYRPSKDEAGGGMRFTRKVGFDLVKLQPEAIYYRINTAKLPFGTSIMQLMDRDLMIDLSIACGRRVTSQYAERFGAWYIVERSIGVRGIPDHVRLSDLLTAFPASADGLTIPIGMALNAKPVYKSLGRMYSMLVAGTIGGGKSNFLNVLLTTLIRRNSPDRLKMILVDLKGGLEFQFYEGIPHLITSIPDLPTGIAELNEQVPGVLRWLHAEGERRQTTMRKAGYKNIGRYNAHRRANRMAHILLVIDEWADVMYNKKIAKECEDVLANIAQRYRAVGIHVILCTQIPKAEVISTRIKGVLPAKVAFSVPTVPSSMVVLDNGDAKGLMPAGRCVFQWDGQYEIQTPYINEEMIDEVVAGAIKGQFEDVDHTKHDVTPLEVLEYALSEENGYLGRDRMFAVFSKRGLTQEELSQWLLEWDNQEFVIGTSLYRVDPPAGSRARRLVAVDEDADDIPDNPEDQPQQKHDVTPEEIREFALIYQGGHLNLETLFGAFRDRGLTKEELRQWLAEMDGKEYQVGSGTYRVDPAAGSRPRRLVKEKNGAE